MSEYSSMDYEQLLVELITKYVSVYRRFPGQPTKLAFEQLAVWLRSLDVYELPVAPSPPYEVHSNYDWFKRNGGV